MIKTLKFVHCADIHLDAPFSEQSGTYSETRRKDIRGAFVNILKIVKEENADLLLISGDLYEHMYIARKTAEWLNMVLSEIQVPVAIIPGNHDPYLLNSWYRSWEWPSNVHILSPESPHLMFEEKQVNLYGIGFSSFKEDKPDLSGVCPPMPGYFNILMFHGTLDMDFTQQAYKPVTSEELGSLGYDYYALGHFHTTRTDYPLKNAINPGSPEPLGFDEPGSHGAFLVTLTMENQQVAVETKRFETAVRVYQDKNIDITGCKNLEELKIRILGLMDGLDPQRDLTRITFKGRTDLAIDSDTLAQMFSDDWLYLRIRNDTQKAFDIDTLAQDQSLKGAFAREMQEKLHIVDEKLKNTPYNEELQIQRKKLNAALNFGLEALQNGKIEWWSEL